MTASTTPRMTPIAIALTVSSSVMKTPLRMRWSNRNCPTTCHSSCLFVATEWISEAANSRISAAATQRPGRRTGMALISSGRPAGASLSAAPGSATSYLIPSLACGAVDRRVAERRALQFPLLEDRLIGAVGDQQLQRREHGLRHAVVLGQRETLGRSAERRARANLDAELSDLVGDDRRVGEINFRASAGEREVGVVLTWEDQQLDRLAGGLALLVLFFGVFQLCGAFLDRNSVAAEFGQRVDLRAARRLGEECLADRRYGDEVHGFLAFLGVREGRGADVVAPRGP